MKSAEIFRIIVLVVISSCTAVSAQEGKPVLNGSEKAAPPTLNEAEKKFKELLTNVTLEGRWCSVTDGEMGPEKQDKYTIVSVGNV